MGRKEGTQLPSWPKHVVYGATFFIVTVSAFVAGLYLLAPRISDMEAMPSELAGAFVTLLAIGAGYAAIAIVSFIGNSIFFRSTARYKGALVDIDKKLQNAIALEDVTGLALDSIQVILGSRKAAILVWENERLEFVPQAHYGVGNFEISIPSGHQLVSGLRKTRTIAAKYMEESEGDTMPKAHNKAMTNVFSWLDMELAVPLFGTKELIGILLVGNKLAGTKYTRADLVFLRAFSDPVAAALQKALVYNESQEFAQQLRQEVEETTNELAQANVQLKNLDKAKSEFLSIASHQLYTPLTSMRGYISMIQEGDFGEVPDKQKQVLEILERSTARLVSLIKNLLDVSRIESGRLELRLESIDLLAMAQELVIELMPNAADKNLHLEFHEPASPVARIVADRERIRQVMLNFVDNAIKYTSIGRVDVYVYQRGQFVVFSVKDTGKGIRKEEVAQLFHKFMRVGGASRFNTEGTGLGLYVARQIVREHNGEIQVESEGESQGSTFLMVIPQEGSKNSLPVGAFTSVIEPVGVANISPGRRK